MPSPSENDRGPAPDVAGRPLTRIVRAAPAMLRPHLDLPGDAAAAYDASTDIPGALGALEAGGFLLPAVRLMAHALLPRQAVWWGWVCVRHTNAAPTAAEVACLDAAEHWVRHPSDEARRAAYAAAEASHHGTAAAWVCTGAFWSGDSISPLGQPPVAPPPHLTGLAVAGAVVLASVRSRPEKQHERLAAFLSSARHIAAGGHGRLEPEAS